MALPPDYIDDLLQAVGTSGVVVIAAIESVVDSGPKVEVRDEYDEQGRFIAPPPGSGQPLQPHQLVTLLVHDVLQGRLREKRVTVSKPVAPYWLTAGCAPAGAVYFLTRGEDGGLSIAAHFGPYSISAKEARAEISARGGKPRWWQFGSSGR